MEDFKVTSLDQLTKVARGEIVPLAGFYEEEPFVVRLKRPSLLSLAAQKKIPNPLLNRAYKLFYGNGVAVKNTGKEELKGNELAENGEIYRIVAKASLVEPTFEELEKAGVELTDVQLFQIWQFSQFGADALENFRKLYSNSKDTEDKQKV